MCLNEALDEIRGKIGDHRLPMGAGLWAEIQHQIKTSGTFDGRFVEIILTIIESFVHQLDGPTVISLLRETETGMADDSDDEDLFVDCVRMDLIMELLEAITDLAWQEGTSPVVS